MTIRDGDGTPPNHVRAGVGVRRPLRGSAWWRGCSDGEGFGPGRRPVDVVMERGAGQLHRGGRRGVSALARSPRDGRVTLRVEVATGVAVPAFEKMSCTFEVRENVKGRPRPVALGAVTVTDPDGDE